MGEPNDDGQYVVKFGVLFDDDEAANTFEAINGTLRTAKKRQIIDFKGQMLLKGPHDNEPITLLIENNDNDDDMEEEEEEDNDNNLEQQTEDTNNIATDDTNIDENINNNIQQQQQTSIIIKQDEEVKQEEESINKEDIIENPSKWSKGKCKSCGHEGNKHQMQWVKKSELQCSPVPKPKATVLSNRHSPSPSPGPQSPSISLAESVESPVV